MQYNIQETNTERQHLLAELLNPLSLRTLEKIQLKKGAAILDIGCGLGDTAMMLAKQFAGCMLTGIDQDADLIHTASGEKKHYSNIAFIAGSALQLPFKDNSFDFVFTRYLLHHIPDAMAAMREMKRVCKRGGVIMAHEPDAGAIRSYPEHTAYETFQMVVANLFADVHIGIKLIGFFNLLSLDDIHHQVQTILADNTSVLKKFYAMTAEAMTDAILERKLMDKIAIVDWVGALVKLQHDPEVTVLMKPSIAVWGTKS